MSDWVTAAVMAGGDTALRRKFLRLRDLGDHAMLDSPAFRQWGDYYTLLQNTPIERWGELLAEAEREEQAVQQGVSA
jgi:hypothetical protein